MIKESRMCDVRFSYLWVVVTLLACATSSFLIVDSWQRYSANPSVISLEKDFRSWQLPFPAVTVCLLDRLNHTTALAIIQRYWNTSCNFCFMV